LNRKNKKILLRLGWFTFILYLGVLTYFLFFSERYGRTIGEEYRYNLVLFEEIKRFFKYRHMLSMEAFLLNMVGNVVAFIPFGFAIPYLSSKQRKFLNVMFLSFEFSLVIEVIQLVFKVGSFDVDDLLLNTIGGIIGYIIFKICYQIYERWYKET